MKKSNNPDISEQKKSGASVEEIWKESWTYITTVVDTTHEPFLILDEDLNVLAANESFYHTFQTEAKVTEGKLVYDLGNKQWDIPSLRKLLEDILPKNTFFKGYEVAHDFPVIGRKVMILNARRIHNKNTLSGAWPQIILLAMEDVTDSLIIAEKLTGTLVKQIELKFSGEVEALMKKIEKLEKEILGFKTKK